MEKKSNEKRAKPRVKIKMIFMVTLAMTADIPATSACRSSELSIVEDNSEAVVGEPAVCEPATDELEKAMATLKPAQKVKPEDAVRDSAVAMASGQEAAYESVAGLLFLNDTLLSLTDSEIFLNLSKCNYFTKFLVKLGSDIKLEKKNSKRGATVRVFSGQACQLVVKNGFGDRSDRLVTTAADTGEEGKTAQRKAADVESKAAEGEREAPDVEAEATDGEAEAEGEAADDEAVDVEAEEGEAELEVADDAAEAAKGECEVADGEVETEVGEHEVADVRRGQLTASARQPTVRWRQPRARWLRLRRG